MPTITKEIEANTDYLAGLRTTHDAEVAEADLECPSCHGQGQPGFPFSPSAGECGCVRYHRDRKSPPFYQKGNKAFRPKE